MKPESHGVHAAVVAALLPYALHRPAPEGVRVVVLWWFDQLRQARAAFPAPDALRHARVASDRLLLTLGAHQELLHDAQYKRELRHLRALNRTLGRARDEAARQEWLQRESSSFTAEVRDEAVQLSEAVATRIEKRTHAVAGAFAKHFDRSDPSFAAALASFTVRDTIGGALSANSFALQVRDSLARTVNDVKESIKEAQAADGRRSLTGLHGSLEALRALLSPFVPEIPEFTALHQSATRAQALLDSVQFASRLAKRADRDGLELLAATLVATRQRDHDTLVREWLEDGGARALAHVPEALAALQVSSEDTPSSAAEAHADAPLEIERKFLLSGVPPEAATVPGTRIEQGWIPGRTLRERLRSSAYPTGVTRYTRTVKFGSGLARVELEEDTDHSVFDTLWPLTATARVRKTRHPIREGAFTWEIDVFSDRDLVLAEVELESADDAPGVPSWLAPWVVREVTGDPAYVNANLAFADTEQGAPPVASDP